MTGELIAAAVSITPFMRVAARAVGRRQGELLGLGQGEHVLDVRAGDDPRGEVGADRRSCRERSDPALAGWGPGDHPDAPRVASVQAPAAMQQTVPHGPSPARSATARSSASSPAPPTRLVAAPREHAGRGGPARPRRGVARPLTGRPVSIPPPLGAGGRRHARRGRRARRDRLAAVRQRAHDLVQRLYDTGAFLRVEADIPLPVFDPRPRARDRRPAVRRPTSSGATVRRRRRRHAPATGPSRRCACRRRWR